MLNLILFAVGTLLFVVIWRFITTTFPKRTSWGIRGSLWRLALGAFLFAPWNIGGDIYTVLGNGVNERGAFYSVSSFYQKSPVRTLTFITPVVFQHGTGHALSFFSVVAAQEPKNANALSLATIVLSQGWSGDVRDTNVNPNTARSFLAVFVMAQHAQKRADSLLSLGIMGQAAGQEAFNVFSLVTLSQYAAENAKNLVSIFTVGQCAEERARILVGIVAAQCGYDVSLGFGIAGYQEGVYARTGIGLAFFQNAVERALVLGGAAVYQRAYDKERWFGFGHSDLTSD